MGFRVYNTEHPRLRWPGACGYLRGFLYALTAWPLTGILVPEVVFML